MRRLVLLVVLVVAACADTGAPAPKPAHKEYAVPDRLLGYTYTGGTIRPIANTQTGIVRGSSLQSAY